ncbi:MAG: hypothetical protein J6X44_11475, partial [Thermoguttaceae bacterium]|nr:hypothetical protein [Thermoguttaceae bacterium]
MQGKTIVIDPAKGPVVLEATTKLLGSDVVVERELNILGEDRDVTVSGNKESNMFVIDSGAIVSISDLTLTEGYAKAGGALVNNGELNLTNVDFTDNEAYWIKSTQSEYLTEGLGGAIANFATLTVDGGTFSGNEATDFGGAIFADTTGDTIVKNATFQGNTAFAGGAIVAQNGTLTVENSNFASNSAERAGAVYTLVPATFVASVFTGNKAEAADYTSRNVVGGAIYAGPNAPLTFKADAESESTLAATFTGNSAEAGGAVYSDAGISVEGDLVATGNKAVASEYVDEVKGDYGAIYANGDLSVTGDVKFDNNTAEGSYGAFYAKNVDVDGALTATGNTATAG